jgi:histidine triad (HIT) family protein
MSCLFCQIATGAVPAKIVRRGNGLLAFQDVNPQAPTHILVIPTEHVATLDETTEVTRLGELLAFARDVAREQKLSGPGYRIVLNTNGDGGQTVFHLHLHLLGGRPMHWPPG